MKENNNLLKKKKKKSLIRILSDTSIEALNSWKAWDDVF
jgi:hypothetical protein